MYINVDAVAMWSPNVNPSTLWFTILPNHFGAYIVREFDFEGRDCIGVGHNSFTLW